MKELLLLLCLLLGFSTSQECTGLLPEFTDTFHSYNNSIWERPSHGIMHCEDPIKECTMMLPSNLKYDSKLPNTTDRGLRLELSQLPCIKNHSLCCEGTKCAKWAGAHLSSRDCMSYGTLEVRVSLTMEAETKGVLFVSSYISSGAEAWNEIDIGFTVTDTANYLTAWFFDVDAHPREKNFHYHKELLREYHTYSFTWMKDHITWKLDGNTIYVGKPNPGEKIPWEPQRIKVILRSLHNQPGILPEVVVHLLHIKYTPHNP